MSKDPEKLTSFYKEEGNKAFQQGKFEDALKFYEKALEFDSLNKFLYGNQAAVFLKLKQYEKAIEASEKAISIDPCWGRAYLRKGTSLFHLEKYLDAKKSYLIGLQYDPDNDSLKKGLEETNLKLQEERLLYRKVNQSVDCFECSLCMKLFYEPVTTPCGHTFCRVCLSRALDHSTTCPLCRNVMHYGKDHPVNVSFQDVLQRFFPEEYQSRKEELKQISIQTEDQMPLFILNTVAFPSVIFPMHIFEPRYRLMLRRCMEGQKRFGLISCKKNNVGSWVPCNIGTCLQIRDVKLLEDGRSYIDTIGWKRFKILEHWDCDGYKVGKVEWFEDTPRTPDDIKQDEELALQIRTKITELTVKHPLCKGLKQLTEIVQTFSQEVPSDSEKFSFWMSAYLPVAGYFKQHLLGTTSVRERLLKIDEILSVKPHN